MTSDNRRQLLFQVILLSAFFGAGSGGLYYLGRAYIDDRLQRAVSALTAEVVQQLEDFKVNSTNDVIDRATACLDRKLNGPELEACVGDALKRPGHDALENPSAPTVNRSPSAAAALSLSGPALVGITKVSFAGAGADPEGDTLTYRWSFGDGVSASGQKVIHVFSAEGTFNVVLTVTDNRGGSATAGLVVQARSLTGHWTPLQNGVPGIDATITQSGTVISGQSTNECCRHIFAGEVSPSALTLVFRFSGCPAETRTFVGTVSADLNTISLAGPNCNLPNTTFGFTRSP